jgi:hypothetical protein
VSRAVLLGAEIEPVRALVGEWSPSERVEIGLLIFPRFDGDSRAFDAFARSALDGLSSPFASATFHPQAGYSVDSPAQMVGFFRRSPDPTIQLVRRSVLERVRAGTSPGRAIRFTLQGWAAITGPPRETVSDRIATDNHARAGAGAQAEIERVLTSIAEDRARTYAKLG